MDGRLSLRTLLCSGLIGLAGAVGDSFQTSPPPPEEYAALYQELDQKITDYDQHLNSVWDGTIAPVTFAAESWYANSNNGTELLDPANYTNFSTEIARLKAMRLGAVSLSVHFPYLYQPYDPVNYPQYLDFYKRVVREIRAQGMKVVIETQTVFPQPDAGGPELREYYASLTLDEYMAARAETAATLARELRPDFLTVISEPDTEAELSGKVALSVPATIVDFANRIVNRVRATGVIGVKIGAGCGSWWFGFGTTVSSLLSGTEIDYVNVHIYPISLDFLPRVEEAADLAAAYGKQVGIGETWLYKFSESEFGLGLSPLDVFARDPFSFWATLDQKFLKALVKLSHYKNFAYASPFYDRYFYSYVEYNDQTKILGPREIDDLSISVAEQAMLQGTFTATGVAYSSYVRAPAAALKAR